MPGIHDSWCHLSLPWLAQSKPRLVHWAWTGQAKTRIDGARSRVYLVPYELAYFLHFSRTPPQCGCHKWMLPCLPCPLLSLLSLLLPFVCSIQGERSASQSLFLPTSIDRPPSIPNLQFGMGFVLGSHKSCAKKNE